MEGVASRRQGNEPGTAVLRVATSRDDGGTTPLYLVRNARTLLPEDDAQWVKRPKRRMPSGPSALHGGHGFGA
ncbi:MAG: hypothetical protein JWN15_1573 [Firmicutes bacterium]|nr:hypothetical protein [Bacillota bacterium]